MLFLFVDTTSFVYRPGHHYFFHAAFHALFLSPTLFPTLIICVFFSLLKFPKIIEHSKNPIQQFSYIIFVTMALQAQLFH
jgi:hypothetical protein